MSKSSIEDKPKIYNKRKNEKTFNYLSTKYIIRKSKLIYLVKLIDKLSYNGLKTNR